MCKYINKSCISPNILLIFFRVIVILNFQLAKKYNGIIPALQLYKWRITLEKKQKRAKKKTIVANSLYKTTTFKTPLPVFRTGISYNVFACRAGVVEWFHWKILYHPSQRQNEPVQNMPATD